MGLSRSMGPVATCRTVSSETAALAIAATTSLWTGHGGSLGRIHFRFGSTRSLGLQGLPNVGVAAFHADFRGTVRGVDLSKSNAIGKCTYVLRHSILCVVPSRRSLASLGVQPRSVPV